METSLQYLEEFEGFLSSEHEVAAKPCQSLRHTQSNIKIIAREESPIHGERHC